jgi:hypothetical protein
MLRCPECGGPCNLENPGCSRDDLHAGPEPQTIIEISSCCDCGKEHKDPTETCQEVGWDVGVDGDGNPYEETQFLCPCGGLVFITYTTKI